MVLLGVVVLAVLVSSVMSQSSDPTVSYSQFLTELEHGEVTKAQVNSNTGAITFVGPGDAAFQTQGPPGGYDPQEFTTLSKYLTAGKSLSFTTPGESLLMSLLPDIFLGALILVFIFWMARRAQGQMGGIMSIGRSRAKVYTTERPRTTFADVAGYDGVKMEIREVVDFLRSSARFKEIGAKIPKGVLLVGPPGTGKTLLARAVAGEAGVPFMSVTGSDFMEMFVGVGASRVRDLFQSARKQAPAIIFVDEIDSIGRKRGAGLGGGHDEREQTLNQMLAEMDGFEATEGIVMMAATNRPDILDPALLRPGRFDRQIVVPLPDLEERLPILKVHCKDKRIGSDVDLSVVARGTPGMSGADLANLVNEAALHAVRRSGSSIAMADFDAARDRVLMGQRRESTVLSEKEKMATAYH
jgi:cell division protease FtsH